MKAAFLSLATLVLTAFAVPAVQDSTAVGAAVAGNAIVVKRDNQDASQIAQALTQGNQNIKEITGAINSTLADAKSGKISEADAGKKATDDLQNLLDQLSGILSQVTNAIGITVTKGEFETILGEVGGLLNEVLYTVRSVLSSLGALPAINSIVQSVLNLVSKLLVALGTALGPGLLSPLLGLLTPLLFALGSGLVGPLLNVVAGLVGSIIPPTGP